MQIDLLQKINTVIKFCTKLNNLKNLVIQNTPKTPEINFNFTSGVFLISGVSVPEDPIQFYTEIINWLENYIKLPARYTKIVFKLSYVNTSSLQFIYSLLQKIDVMSKCRVQWFYFEEDIDMKEMGEDFKDALSVKFSFVEVETVE